MKKSNFPKYLDAERLFRKYWEDGAGRSTNNLAEWALHQGMKSHRGKNPTPMGVWKAMWRWASLKENSQLAFQIVNSNCETQVSWEDWKKKMIHIHIPSAWQHDNHIKRDKFLRENGWVDEQN